jgi:hypothetical protein
MIFHFSFSISHFSSNALVKIALQAIVDGAGSMTNEK